MLGQFRSLFDVFYLQAYNLHRFTDYVSTVTEEDLKKAVKATDDSHLSVQNLIAKQDFATIINNPREYQIELFEKAKEENLIAVLDTGKQSFIDHLPANSRD